MPDGTRKRRYSTIKAKRDYYAAHRARRWARAMWNGTFEGWVDGRPQRITEATSPPHERVLATA